MKDFYILLVFCVIINLIWYIIVQYLFSQINRLEYKLKHIVIQQKSGDGEKYYLSYLKSKENDKNE